MIWFTTMIKIEKLIVNQVNRKCFRAGVKDIGRERIFFTKIYIGCYIRGLQTISLR